MLYSSAVALREAYTAAVTVKVVLLVPELSAVTVTDSGYSRLLGVKVSVAPALHHQAGSHVGPPRGMPGSERSRGESLDRVHLPGIYIRCFKGRNTPKHRSWFERGAHAPGVGCGPSSSTGG